MSGYSGASSGDLFGQGGDTAPVSREFSGLFPPGTRGVAAAGTEVTNTRHADYSGLHEHPHADGQGGTHEHPHGHLGDAAHTTPGHVAEPNHSHAETGDGLPG